MLSADSVLQRVPAGYSPTPEMNTFSTEIDFSILHDCEVPSPSQPGSWYYETSSPPNLHSPPYDTADLKNYHTPPQHTYSVDFQSPSELPVDEDSETAKLGQMMDLYQTKVKIEQNEYSAYLADSQGSPDVPSILDAYSLASPASSEFCGNGFVGVGSDFPESTVNLDDLLGEDNQPPPLAPIKTENNRHLNLTCESAVEQTRSQENFPVHSKQTFQIQVQQPPVQAAPSRKQVYHIKQTVPQKQNYELLRTYLGDKKTFEKYPHYRPLDLTDVAKLAGARNVKTEKSAENMNTLLNEKLEQDVFFNQFLEQMLREIEEISRRIDVSPEPSEWCVLDACKWLVWACEYYRLPSVSMQLFHMDGEGLLKMSEEEFENAMPQGGDKLYWSLYTWWKMSEEKKQLKQQQQTQNRSQPQQSPQPGSPPQSEDMVSYRPLSTWSDSSPSPISNLSTSDQDQTQSDDDDDMDEMQSTSSRSGSHIHLWQFLKELLTQPQVFASCIRWTDRSKGIFKIEDSVRVARLWGRRKNRPAMNYDKLSRSIRQYYKKGIMKKTERSQRLVYQFCSPYHQ